MDEELTLLYNLALVYIENKQNEKLQIILDIIDDVNIKMNITKSIKKQIGISLLHVACANGTLQSVKMLVAKGAEINPLYDYSITPFEPLEEITLKTSIDSYIEQFTPLDEAILRMNKYNKKLTYKGPEYAEALEICLYMYEMGAVNEMIL